MFKKIFLWGQHMPEKEKEVLKELDKQPYFYNNSFGDFKRMFRDKFPDVNDDTIMLYESDVFNGEKVLFQHTSSDFFFFFMKNLEYDKEHNALIEKINK